MKVCKLIQKTLILLCLLSFSDAGTLTRADVQQKTAWGDSLTELDEPEHLLKIDTLYVIHFHPTVQCSCCINVGVFAKKGLERYYTEQYKDGRIIFKEYDIDEDTSTAKKYEIFWSALGFEKFSGGKSEFKEIESVWEFCEEEKTFLPNFRKEMDQFMRESGDDEPRTETQNKKGK